MREKKDVVFKMYNLPGGHLNPGEKVLDGLQREIREELGCEIEAEGMLAVYSIIEEESHYINFVFLARVSNGVPRANTAEIYDAGWYSLDDIRGIPDDRILYPRKFREVLSSYQSGSVFPLTVFHDM